MSFGNAAAAAAKANTPAAAPAATAAPAVAAAPSDGIDINSLLANLQASQQGSQDALSQSLAAANQQAASQLAMQYQQQIANLYAQETQSQTAADTSVAQLQPQLGELQAQHDLTQGNYLHNQAYANAAQEDKLDSRGLGSSGINLGAEGRFLDTQNQTVANQNLQLQTQQDAINRAILAAQQTNASNQGAYKTQIQALQNAQAPAATPAAAGGSA